MNINKNQYDNYIRALGKSRAIAFINYYATTLGIFGVKHHFMRTRLAIKRV